MSPVAAPVDDDEPEPHIVSATLDDLLSVALRVKLLGSEAAAAQLAHRIVTEYWELAYTSAQADARERGLDMAREAGASSEIASRESSLQDARLSLDRAASALHEDVVGPPGTVTLQAADALAIDDGELAPGAFTAQRQRVVQAGDAVERAERDLETSGAKDPRLQAAVTAARVARARAQADLREAIADDELARGTLLARYRIVARH